MKPNDFERRSEQEIAAKPGFDPVAGPTALSNGYQAAAYYGRDPETDAGQFVLHVADTDPDSTAFAEQVFPRTQVDPGDEGYQFVGVSMEPTFQGLGDITVPYPE
jgi:hypothetical protein